MLFLRHRLAVSGLCTLLALVLHGGPAAAATTAPACGTGGGAIAGRLRLPAALNGTTPQLSILPSSPTTDAYLADLRALFASHPSPAAVIGIFVNRGAFESVKAAAERTMRVAAIGPDGTFSCAGLAAGTYRVIIFDPTTGQRVGPFAQPSVAVFVASAVVTGARATLSRFVPLGDLR